MFIPDPDLDFLPIPDPGVKKALDPGSARLEKPECLARELTHEQKRSEALEAEANKVVERLLL